MAIRFTLTRIVPSVLVFAALLAVGLALDLVLHLAGVMARGRRDVPHPFRAVTSGPLRPGHARLRDDCFACHAPFAGAPRDPDGGVQAAQGGPARGGQARTTVDGPLTDRGGLVAAHARGQSSS